MLGLISYLWTDSSMRFLSGTVVFTTSSNCIIISAPMAFCILIECSGVNMTSSLCWFRDWNFTPCSVISASLSKDTIWNPPESVSKFRSQFINLCKPPALFRMPMPLNYGLKARNWATSYDLLVWFLNDKCLKAWFEDPYLWVVQVTYLLRYPVEIEIVRMGPCWRLLPLLESLQA